MANEGLYDMRKKLLELQNELLKDAMDKQETPPNTPTPRPIEKHDEINANDMMKLIKEIHSNQQHMMDMLTEILEMQKKKL